MIYQLRKYVQRNRGPVTTAACIIFVLLAALGVSLVLVRQIYQRERDLREIARVSLFADAFRLEKLLAEADDLWPPHSAMIPDLESWLERAEGFAGSLGMHQADLVKLRASSPYTEEEQRRDQKSHPLAAALRELKARAGDVENEVDRLRQLGHSPVDDFTPLSYGTYPNDKHPAYYFRGTFELDEAAVEGVRVKIAVDDGAVVHLNGSELWRVNLPDGEVGHGTLAEISITGDAEPLVEEGVVPASRLRLGENLLAVEVHQWGAGSSDVYFDVELIGIDPRNGLSWRYHDGGVYLGDSWTLLGYDDSQWSRGAPPFGYGFEEEARRLAEKVAELKDLDDRIARLQAVVSTRRTFTFDADEKSFVHGTLSDLVQRLQQLSHPDPQDGNIAEVRRRLDFARTVRRRTIDDHRVAWKTVIESIASSPRYDGLKIEPQEGLIPLGKDRISGLWEFAHLQSGEPPRRVDGGLQLNEKAALVFVLIPGGAFLMGAEPPSEQRKLGSPNVAPIVAWREGPIHEARLGPFFLSKYEMTQSQWKRLTGDNPSFVPPGRIVGSHAHSLLHPVDSVSWDECREVLKWAGLRFPTEAQWEYAARAGSSAPWWTGDEKESLLGAANLRDLAYEREFAIKGAGEKWDDGFAFHSPVGHFKANDFGLHDTLGNVWEWCLEPLILYGDADPEGGDGERRGRARAGDNRILRGGAWDTDTQTGRTAYRHEIRRSDRPGQVGIRPARELKR